MRDTATIFLILAATLAGVLPAQGRPRPPLPKLQKPTTVEQILKDLQQKNYQVLRRAVVAARTTKDPRLLEKLLQLAQHARHPNIRMYACETLGHYRDKRIFDLLSKAAAEGPLSARNGALLGLGLLQDKRSYDILVKGLKDRNNWSAAATGLRHLGDTRGAEPLVRLIINNNHDHFVFGRVTEALFALDRDRSVDEFFAIITIAATYKHHRLDLMLGRVKTDSVRKRAEKLLEHDDLHVQKVGLRILGAAGNVQTVAILLKVMDGNKDLRLNAVEALGELGHELAVPQMARYLKSDKDAVRSSSAKALGKIGHTTAVRPLVAALHAEKRTIPKLRMIEALGLIGDKRGVTELGKHLEDDSIELQPMTISSIWSFPYNASVKWAAWWALATIRDGKQPRPVADVFQSHGRGKPPETKEMEATTKWWNTSRGKPGFSLKK